MDDKILSDNPVSALKSLKNLLDREKVSLLVGSGFSKNISNIFPNWSELLCDMVIEMYKPEIEHKLKMKGIDRLGIPKASKIFNQQFIIADIICREGYLDLVSQYIKRKGFRESIDAYIEEHIPIIEKSLDTDEYSLKFLHSKRASKRVPLNSLDLHKRLISLKWNNIFTTNYDNAIECAYEDQKIIFDSISEKIVKLNSQIKKNEEQISSYMTKKSTESRPDLEMHESNSSDTSSVPAFNDHLGNIDEKIDELRKANENITIEINSLTTKIDNERINVVKDSSELELQKNRNIIKLHGSIPLDREENFFGFDGDVHKRYVICKDDYQDYPQKHEAFTQLMRITLLQDSFCLIGFSGIDPNFIAWINWVRDIIEKKSYQTANNKEESLNNSFKIYLVDIGNDELTIDKELFFKNHRIVKISLASNEIREFLGTTNREGKVVLKKFLTYLSDNKNNVTEEERIKSYKSIWEELSKSVFGHAMDEEKLIENIDKLWELKAYSKVKNFDVYEQNTSTDFLRYIDRNYKYFSSHEILPFFFKLLLLSLNDSYLIFSMHVIPDQTFEKIKDNVPVPFARPLNLLHIRGTILSNPNLAFDKIFEKKLSKDNDDELMYEKALYHAFNFSFPDLLFHLNNWTPNAHYVALKASLLAQINPKDAYNLLEDFVKDLASFSSLSNQEKINTYYLLLLTRSSVRWERDDKILDEINKLKALGAKDIRNNIEILSDKINKNIDNSIRPYPRGDFDFYHDMSGNDRFLLGVQYVQYLIQSGLFLEVQNARFIDHKDWYPSFKLVFEEFPFPALYYSLQYQDGNFTKRIGQDFVNSEKLNEKLSEIYQSLYRAYISEATLEKIKDSILYFLSEIVAAIPANEWENTFLKIWDLQLREGKQFSEIAFPIHSFVKKSLSYLATNKTIAHIIKSILNNRHKSELAINYLYILSSRKIIKHSEKYLIRTSIKLQIEEMIEEIPTHFIRSMYLLGNLEPIINFKQKTKIKEYLENTDLGKFDSYNIWYVVLIFAQNNVRIINNLKTAILKSKYLFASGVRFDKDGRMSATNEHFIQLRNFTKNKSLSDGIKWSREETLSLYNTLRRELSKIEKWGNRNKILLNFKDLLDEMRIFLLKEEHALKRLTDYEKITEKIDRLLSIEKGEGSLLQRLMDDTEEYYFHALEELTRYLFENSKVSPFENCIELVLSKILSISDPNLLFTLKKVAIWVRELKDEDCLKQYSEKLLLILERYKLHDFNNSYKPAYFLHLSTIAFVLSYWGIKNKVVDFWIEQGRNSRYNIM